MAEIRPFRALRFTEKAGALQELTCPPYDIISESQRLAYLKRNPHNIIRLELPRDGENPYAQAGEPCGHGWRTVFSRRMTVRRSTFTKSSLTSRDRVISAEWRAAAARFPA